MQAAIEAREAAIPGHPARDGRRLSRRGTDPPYTFGSDPTISARLFDRGLPHTRDASQLRFPRDVVFVKRMLGGHFGTLGHLQATARWREPALAFVG